MIKIALPAGALRPAVGELLVDVGLPFDDYVRESRSYVVGRESNGVKGRVFRERDIPIQVALGNYDLGICSLAWIEDLLAGFPSDALAPVCDLGRGDCSVYAATAAGPFDSIQSWSGYGHLRVASEYGNLAERFVRHLRLPSYRVLEVWGAAEAYPPEDADVVVVSAQHEPGLREQSLVPVYKLLDSSAWLVANRQSLARKEMSGIVAPLVARGRRNGRQALTLPAPLSLPRLRAASDFVPRQEGIVRLALPDGHQQQHAARALAAAGLTVTGYDESDTVTRPRSDLVGLELKVIRPQDMPQQVALGHFDLAITGRDWLLDHKYRFPASPVEEVVDLGVGRYSIAAVVSEDTGATTIAEALTGLRQDRRSVRVASEYVNIADHYARSRHFGRYRMIPISGASEGFVPEDADVLIEGTETGATLAANRLRVVETLFESTTCLIAHVDKTGAKRSERRAEIIRIFGAS